MLLMIGHCLKPHQLCIQLRWPMTSTHKLPWDRANGTRQNNGALTTSSRISHGTISSVKAADGLTVLDNFENNRLFGSSLLRGISLAPGIQSRSSYPQAERQR